MPARFCPNCQPSWSWIYSNYVKIYSAILRHFAEWIHKYKLRYKYPWSLMVIVLIFWFMSDMDVAVYRSCRPHLVWYRKICNCLPVKQNKYIQMYWPQCSYHNTLYIINSPGASSSDWPNQGPFYREVLHGVPEVLHGVPDWETNR